MLGTIVNAVAILVGGVLGLVLKSRLPEKYTAVFFQVIGLFTLVLGFSMSIKTEKPLLMVFSLILGGDSGIIINLQQRIDTWAIALKNRFKLKGDRFAEGMVVAFLLFCMGSLTVLGALEEGTCGEPKLFYVKSLMDGFSALALASTLGVGVIFSILPLLVYQGGLTWIAAATAKSLSNAMVNELSAVGGVLLIALGINILGIKKLEVVNLLPSLVFIILLFYLFG